MRAMSAAWHARRMILHRLAGFVCVDQVRHSFGTLFIDDLPLVTQEGESLSVAQGFGTCHGLSHRSPSPNCSRR